MPLRIPAEEVLDTQKGNQAWSRRQGGAEGSAGSPGHRGQVGELKPRSHVSPLKGSSRREGGEDRFERQHALHQFSTADINYHKRSSLKTHLQPYRLASLT